MLCLRTRGIQQLAGMTELEELNLYGARISNAAVEVLKDLKDLRTVDLRYTRVSRTGVERLKTAVPQCDITFLDPSVRPALPAEADKNLAGAEDAIAARWVRALGGKAVVENGRLREVSLAATSVTDELLRNLSDRKHLRKLELNSTEIGDPGVQYLAGMMSLAELDLSGTAISDAGLAHLAGLSALRKLGLAHTQIVGTGLKYLEGIALEELSPVQFTHQRSRIGTTCRRSLRCGTWDWPTPT